MTSKDTYDGPLSIQSAARIAEQLLERANDGTRLFTVHKHYPTQGAAISFGFYLGCGFILAVCFAALIGRGVGFVLETLS